MRRPCPRKTLSLIKQDLLKHCFWKIWFYTCVSWINSCMLALSLMSWVGGELGAREMNGLHSKADISWYVNSPLTTCAHFALNVMIVLFNKFEYSNTAADTISNSFKHNLYSIALQLRGWPAKCLLSLEIISGVYKLLFGWAGGENVKHATTKRRRITTCRKKERKK